MRSVLERPTQLLDGPIALCAVVLCTHEHNVVPIVLTPARAGQEMVHGPALPIAIGLLAHPAVPMSKTPPGNWGVAPPEGHYDHVSEADDRRKRELVTAARVQLAIGE